MTFPVSDPAKGVSPAAEFMRSRNVDVANALNIVRPTLGNDAGVALYRLLRLVALEDIMGRGARALPTFGGEKIGLSWASELSIFWILCKALKWAVPAAPRPMMSSNATRRSRR